MKSKFYFISLVYLIIGFAVVVSNFAFDSLFNTYAIQSSGTENYFEITTAEQLFAIDLEENLNKNFILKNNIDLTEDLSWQDALFDPENGFLPINAVNNFGIFDGNGYIIKGLYINRPGLGKTGLFSDSNLTIQNLKAEYSDDQPFGLAGGNLVGGLVANNLGTISHCSVKADIKSSNTVGGLVGSNSGNIDNSFFEGTVQGKIAGGLVGKCILGNINNCYSSGTINSKIAGGFIGESTYDNVRISNSFSFAYIFDNAEEIGANFFGSFICERGINVTIDNCYSLNNIATVDQGSLEGIIPLEANKFLQQDKFHLDFDSIWYYNELAAHPLIRDVFVILHIENSGLGADNLIKRNYYYIGEFLQISLLNFPDKEFAFIKVNEQDKTNEVIDKVLECVVEERTQIVVRFEFLMQVRINQNNSNDVVLKKEFYKAGEKVVFEVKNRSLSQIKKVYINLKEAETVLENIKENGYEFLVVSNIEEGAFLTVSVDYFSYLWIVITGANILLVGTIIIIIISIIRRKTKLCQKK